MKSQFIPHAAELRARLLLLKEATIPEKSLAKLGSLSCVMRTLIVILELTTKTLACEPETKCPHKFEARLELFSLKWSLERLKKCQENQIAMESSDMQWEQSSLWQEASLKILSSIGFNLRTWLNTTPKSLERVVLLCDFLKMQGMNPDDSAKLHDGEKSKAEGDSETLQLMTEAETNGGDSTIHELMRLAREWGYDYKFLARKPDVTNKEFDISVTNLAAYTISLMDLQFGRYYDAKSERDLYLMLDEIPEGKLSWKDVERVGGNNSARVHDAWAAAPGWLDCLNNGVKMTEEFAVIHQDSVGNHERTFRDILRRSQISRPIPAISPREGHLPFEPLLRPRRRHDGGGVSPQQFRQSS
ncbi:hypothetical protein CCUS01_01247 [Colletotrichum cuscutae]|uniref:Uncharacterized protein n=1 Tax=Colletotrichum cuscutae TaxID=1209917 RepID=A0AAI9V0D3_9PEZI|nr:hypothetical protein CCUS01_01247 [Colletotrichum cuscutae]